MIFVLRLVRTLHGWMGVIVVPWVILYGLTGFYLNHERQVNSFFVKDTVDQHWSEDASGRLPTEEAARNWLVQQFPDLHVNEIRDETYHGKSAFVFDAGRQSVIAPKNSSSYFVKDRYVRRLFDASGAIVHTHRYWPSMLKELHVRGWLNSPVGTTVADVFALVLVTFGVTGAFLWFGPKLLRLKARRHLSMR